MKPYPLIQMGWVFPRYVQGRAAIKFVVVNALAHAVGRNPESILAMLGKRHEEKGQGYPLELTPGDMLILPASCRAFAHCLPRVGQPAAARRTPSWEVRECASSLSVGMQNESKMQGQCDSFYRKRIIRITFCTSIAQSAH